MLNETGCEVTGVLQVTKRLHTVAGETAKGMERGLVISGIALQRLSQKVVPVDTGLLRSTAFTRKIGSGFRTQVSVGYSTTYAIYVHEDLQARHAPGKIAKYLEVPALENVDMLREIIRFEAARGDKGAIPQLAPPPAVGQHALVPVMPKGPGSFVEQVAGRHVTYVRQSNSKSGYGGWRRKR